MIHDVVRQTCVFVFVLQELLFSAEGSNRAWDDFCFHFIRLIRFSDLNKVCFIVRTNIIPCSCTHLVCQTCLHHYIMQHYAAGRNGAHVRYIPNLWGVLQDTPWSLQNAKSMLHVFLCPSWRAERIFSFFFADSWTGWTIMGYLGYNPLQRKYVISLSFPFKVYEALGRKGPSVILLIM